MSTSEEVENDLRDEELLTRQKATHGTKNYVNGGTHYTGQRADKETLSAFQVLSIVDRTAVATSVKNAEVHTTVREKINEFERLLNRKRKRESTIF